MINLFRKNIKNLSKALRVSLGLLLVATLATPMIASTSTLANTIPMEGDVSVRNASRNDQQYVKSVDIALDEIAQVQLWHHNMKAPDTEVATNTVVRFEVPDAAGTTQTIRGISKSDNGNTISDTATVKLSTERARVEYVPGTAKFKYNKGAADGKAECITGYDYPAESCFATISIPDEVVNGGVNLDKYRGGPLEGCNAYHESVTIQVRSIVEVVQINKYVREIGSGADGWVRTMDVVPGQKVEYLITFKNVGNKTLNNIVVADNLPLYHEYVDNTAMLQNSKFPSGGAIKNDDDLFNGGFNSGDYAPGARGSVWFTALIKENVYERCGVYQIRNVGFVNPDEIDPYYSTAEVNINNECEEVPDPVYSCEQLTVARLSEDTFKFTVKATAKDGATISNYRINPGDGSDVIVSENNMTEHTYVAPGTYTVEAKVRFDVNGETKTVTSNDCKKKITIEKEEPYYSCDEMLVTLVKDNTYEFTVNGSAGNGATITEYGFEFGDGSDVLISEDNTVEHTFNAPGTYTVMAAVVVDVNGEIDAVSSVECTAEITVDEEEKQPIYTCDDLTVKLVKDRTFKFTTDTTARNGATVKDYTYDFGDGSDELLTDKNMVEHTYKKAGTYTATAIVRFDVNAEVKTAGSENCKVKITISDTEEPQVEGETTTKPTTLPSTGAGSIAGAFAAITAAGAAGHSLITRRRK